MTENLYLCATHQWDGDVPCPGCARLMKPVRDVFDYVIDDIEARDRMGWKNHDKPLYGNDGRDFLREAYEEALDMCVYLRTALFERDGR